MKTFLGLFLLAMPFIALQILCIVLGLWWVAPMALMIAAAVIGLVYLGVELLYN